MMPQRIQRKRTKGWRMPAGAVYVGRPTKWGNPWTISKRYETDGWYADTPQIAVDLYRAAIELNDSYDPYHRECPNSEEIRAELAGKDLACWCPLDQPCHADVLLAIASGGPT